jgi:hypothetical protein
MDADDCASAIYSAIEILSAASLRQPATIWCFNPVCCKVMTNLTSLKASNDNEVKPGEQGFCKRMHVHLLCDGGMTDALLLGRMTILVYASATETRLVEVHDPFRKWVAIQLHCSNTKLVMIVFVNQMTFHRQATV